MKENPLYLKNQIITYLGNKRSLLPYIEIEIKKIQKKLRKTKTINADLFSGSGVVARLMKQYSSKLIVNDLELYSRVINECYLTNSNEVDWIKYRFHKDQLDLILKKKQFVEGIISKNYAPKDDMDIKPNERVFYTSRNALTIDTIRYYIDEVPDELKKLFLGPLLSEASIKTNTAGIFKGFYKDSSTGIGKFGGNGEYALNRIMGRVKIDEPVLSNFNCDYEIYQMDANDLVKEIKGLDIVYIDPPYNQHPYGSNYFMLNMIVEKSLPSNLSKISGIPKNWNRSAYNIRSQVLQTFDDLVMNIDSKYILISYNSEGYITYDEMSQILNKYGNVEVHEIVYNTYRGSRNLSERNLYVKEYLFILKKNKGV
jgi:adenine-specific DNA-methyltransferase